MNTAQDADFPVEGSNWEAENRTERLKQAVREAGGNLVVAERAGLAVSTLGGYLGGGEMKLSRAVAIARATGVRLEWLAEGTGPMRGGTPSPAAAAPAAAEAPQPFRLFGNVKIDRLIAAYEGSCSSIARSPQAGDNRLLMHLTVVMYDALSEAAEAEAPGPGIRR